MTNTHAERRQPSRPPFVILGQQAFSEAASHEPFHDDLDEKETPNFKVQVAWNVSARVTLLLPHLYGRFQYT